MKAKTGKVIITAIFVILVLLMTASVVLLIILPNYDIKASSLYGFATNGFPLILGLSFLVLSFILISSDNKVHIKKSEAVKMAPDALYEYLVKGKGTANSNALEQDATETIIQLFRTASENGYLITFCSVKNSVNCHGIDNLFQSFRIRDRIIIVLPFFTSEMAHTITESIGNERDYLSFSPENPVTEKDFMVFLCPQT